MCYTVTLRCMGDDKEGLIPNLEMLCFCYVKRLKLLHKES